MLADSGATNHYVNNDKLLKNKRKFHSIVKVADDRSLPITSEGELCIQAKKKIK